MLTKKKIQKSKAKTKPKVRFKLPLINIIAMQLRDKGYFAEIDCFSDKSASWIVMSKVPRVKQISEGKEQLIHMTFNYEGTIMTDIQYTEEIFRLQTLGQKVVM